MAEAATAHPEQTQQSQGECQPYSRPVFHQNLNVNSLQAQRVMTRSFDRVSNALFSLDVILRTIGDQKEINKFEKIIRGQIDKVFEDMTNTMDQLRRVMTDNGIEAVPGYSAPVDYSIEITSPQVAQFARLIRNLDKLMSLIDTLWLNSVLSSQQRSDATYEWQQRLIKLAGRIIGMEKRARISAHTKGKDKEVAKAAPEQETTDPELSSQADAHPESESSSKAKAAEKASKASKASDAKA